MSLSVKSISDAKRLIGRKFDDAVVQSDMKHWPFKVVNDSSKPKVEVEYKGEIKTFYAEEISSMVLIKMKEIAEAYLGKVVNKKKISSSCSSSSSRSIMCITLCLIYNNLVLSKLKGSNEAMQLSHYLIFESTLITPTIITSSFL